LARSGFPQAVTSAQYDVNNELTQWNGTNISYDLNGNTQSDGTNTYTWNARNQLSGRGGVTFQHDAYGRHMKNSAGNNLLYDGGDVTQELSGTTPVANRVVTGTDQFANRTESSGTVAPITDGLGSILALADASGNLATQRRTSAVHGRMPVILDPDNYDLWLDPGMQNASEASGLLKPFDARRMRCYPVSTRINRVANDDEGCSAPVELAQIQNPLFS